MNTWKRPIIIYFIISGIIGLLLFFAPISLFDCTIEMKSLEGSYEVDTALRLSHVLGYGLEYEDMTGIIGYRLNATGWFMVFVMFVGLPGLLAYRSHLRRETKD